MFISSGAVIIFVDIISAAFTVCRLRCCSFEAADGHNVSSSAFMLAESANAILFGFSTAKNRSTISRSVIIRAVLLYRCIRG